MKQCFTPVQIGSLTLKNRFTMTPMEHGLAEIDGAVTDKMCAFFTECAKHDAAMIFTGPISISPEGRGLLTQLCLYEERHIAGLKKLTAAVHHTDSKIAAQLYHAGREASESITGLTPLAPSAIPCAILSNHPREMTLEEMAEIKQKFVQGALWSIEAGFDLIEIHLAHGYLLHSFLSPHSNHRTDGFGGSFENRLKYPMEVLNAVIAAVNGKVPVTIRISADEYLEDGLGFQEVKEVCKEVEKVGVAGISLTSGCYDAVESAIQPMFIPQGFLLPFAAELKKTVSIPIITTAGLNSAESIEDAIESGKTDLAAVGRGLEAMNSHCLANLGTRQKRVQILQKAEPPKNVIIVGAGPAGMQAAITASDRGHHVTLISQGLGGRITEAAVPPEKGNFLLFRDYLIHQIKKRPIQVLEETISTPEDIRKFQPEHVILAFGAVPVLPLIKGITLPHVMTADEILLGKRMPTGQTVILGGGLIGNKAGQFLVERGVDVTIVEVQDNIAKDIGSAFMDLLFVAVERLGIAVRWGSKVTEITDGGVHLENDFVPAANVVIAVGYQPNAELIASLCGAWESVRIIGDAENPRHILDAVNDAYAAAAAI